MTGLLVPLAIAIHVAPTTLVAPPWKTVGVSAEMTEFYSDHLAQALRGRGFKVLTTAELSAVISLEHQRELLGCEADTQSCLAELGAAAGAEAAVMVNLALLESAFQGNIKIVSTRTAEVLSATSVTAPSEKALLTALDEAAERLGEAVFGPAPATRGFRRFWWVPAAFAVAGALAGAAGIAASRQRYTELTRDLSDTGLDATAMRAASDGKAFQNLGVAGFCIAAAGVVGVAAVLLFGAPRRVVPTIVATPWGMSVTLMGRL
jgi:hypothetical protein